MSGASIQVVAFFAGFTCLISAIIARPFGIPPICLPAATTPFQRISFGLLGVCFITIATWSLVSLNSLETTVAEIFQRLVPGPERSGTGDQPWFTVGDERVSISSVSSPGQTGIYVRNVGTKRIYFQFDATGSCEEASCHDTLTVDPIASGQPAGIDATQPCDADGHLSFDYTALPAFGWKVWVGAAVAPLRCS